MESPTKSKLLETDDEVAKKIKITSAKRSHQQHPPAANKSLKMMGFTSGFAPSSCYSNDIRATQSGQRRLLATSALAFCCLIILASVSSWALVGAEHALSEVWSETDGLRMKYSTDHEDLLSTKGSELSLSQHQPSGAHEESADANSSGGGEESAKSEAAAGDQTETGSDSESQSGESNEQGADSSRQTEKVQPVGRQFSSLASGTHHSTTKHQQQVHRFTDAPQRGFETRNRGDSSNSNSDESSEDNSENLQASRQKSAAVEAPEVLSFDSALESTGGARGGEESSSADHGDDESDARANGNESSSGVASAAGKFRSPGRHFKEAVRHNSDSSDESSPGPQRQQKSAPDSDDDSNSDSESSTPNREENSSSSSQGGESESNDSSEGGSAGPASGEEVRSRKTPSYGNMIDFDSMSARPAPELTAAAQAQEEGVDARERGMPFSGGYGAGFAPANGRAGLQNMGAMMAANNEVDDGSNESPADGLGYYPRPMPFAVAATSHKERGPTPDAKPATKTSSNAGLKTPPRRGSGSPATSSQPARPQPYFRGQQRLNQANSASVVPTPAHHSSPDSVRDDFISPGHYPGSMPYLTQAASETQRKRLEAEGSEASSGSPPPPAVDSEAKASVVDKVATKPQLAASGDNKQQESSSQQQQLVASDTTFGNPIEAAENRTVAPITTTATTDARTTVIVGRAQVVEVTPVPEVQPESQQIMAPTLMSTTTMAPMPAATTQDTNRLEQQQQQQQQHKLKSNGTSDATTGQQQPAATSPSLKRFKFRKYR